VNSSPSKANETELEGDSAKMEAANMLVSLSGGVQPKGPVFSTASCSKPNVFVPISAQSSSRFVLTDTGAGYRDVVIKPGGINEGPHGSSPIPTPRFVTKPMDGIIRFDHDNHKTLHTTYVNNFC